MLKKMIKGERGLTLIELLAVIVILGIIAAIAVPSIGGIIQRTKDDAKVAEGIQIISAAKLYTTANPISGASEKLDDKKLGQYTDSLDDTDYEVLVEVDSASGKYSYYLQKHDAANVVKPADAAKGLTEKELQEKKR